MKDKTIFDREAEYRKRELLPRYERRRLERQEMKDLKKALKKGKVVEE